MLSCSRLTLKRLYFDSEIISMNSLVNWKNAMHAMKMKVECFDSRILMRKRMTKQQVQATALIEIHYAKKHYQHCVS